jgi:hypothetical protein
VGSVFLLKSLIESWAAEGENLFLSPAKPLFIKY